MSGYDNWLTTDRANEWAEKAHQAFDGTQDYFDAYIDYADSFDSSTAYDEAFDRWMEEQYDRDNELVDYTQEYDESDNEESDND